MQSQNIMDEKTMLNDLLMTQKQLMTTYSSLLGETSCPKMRGMLQDLFIGNAAEQYKIFHIMNQKGWYPTKDAPEQDVNQAKQTAQQMKSTLH